MRYLLLCDDSKPETVVGLCRQRGLGIEVQAFYHPRALSDTVLLEKTADLVAGLPVVAMHGPFGDLNPGSFDPLVRETARQRIQEGFDVASRLGANHIVYHDGRVPRTNPEESWIKTSAGFWKTFMEQVPQVVNVYLENLLEEGPRVLSGIIDQVGSSNLHAILDIGHAHCNSRTPVVQWIVSLGDRIRYVHLHDNHGEHDEHLGLGEGSIPVQDVCHALEEYAPDAIWAIEAEGDGISQSLEWLDRNGFATNDKTVEGR
jgi:sugar phosphate isomerase/epimerase